MSMDFGSSKKDFQPSSDVSVRHVYFIVTTDGSAAEKPEQTTEQPETVIEPTSSEMEVDVNTEQTVETAETPDNPQEVEDDDEEQSYSYSDVEHVEQSNDYPEEPLQQQEHVQHEEVQETTDDTESTIKEDPNTSDDEGMTSEEEMIENDLSAASSSTAVGNTPTRKQGVQCSICPSIIKDNWNLLKHIKRYHQDHPTYWAVIAQIKPLLRVACGQCQKIFGNQKILLEHEQKVHHTSIGATCVQCGKFFKTEQHMKLHIKYMHLRQPGTYLCDLCPSKFNTKNVLREHIKYSHSTVDRSNKCTECDFVYAFKKQFYEHFTRVHGPKKHTCPYCEYKCATKWYMKKHMKNCAPKTMHMSQGQIEGLNKRKATEAPMSEASATAQHMVDLGQVLRQVEQLEGRATDETLQSRQEGDGDISWEIVEQDGAKRIEYVPSHGLQVKVEGRQENPITGMFEVNGEKRQRISLTSADGTQQTIELILPK